MIQEGVFSFLEAHPANKYYIGYSGGLDSHVLLHACAALYTQYPQRFQFAAIHIHHGLQAVAEAWVEHAWHICAGLKLPLNVIYLNLKPVVGESLEAIARRARYQAFSAHLAADEMLLTAHHQDDQAETFLLNALRGSGGAGLAAMPRVRGLGLGKLGRPLLAFSRVQLEAYAALYQLPYVEDPTNAETQFDRNYLRHEILPRLQIRWPAANQTLSRAAAWQAEQQQILAQLLAQQLPQFAGSRPHTLSVRALNAVDALMQKVLIRHWLQQLGFTLPAAKKLQSILMDVLAASSDAMPCVKWQSCELRRYRDDLYALQPLSPHDPTQVWVWEHWEQDFYLDSLGCGLSKSILVSSLKQQAKAQGLPITVRFRQGGERLQREQGYSLELKHLFQTAGIPPWERERIPLVYVGDELRLVVGIYPKP
ncbi:tRNA lysidine(34) synthetase TilS [uncultured Thiothrix sp.]|uniref:tRNA lysidine(34) synthetase TilS n=1 Tax=uncultured Thiothrix sp. TaxID=223185 RepID=UPI002616FCDD|nr:tRNA lysidine(34) synthetase TilS [uncultured Thiothrix sp.]HMT93799.1 tRNA lysidine(34) synthetase TilS [Thiolinea sp.]